MTPEEKIEALTGVKLGEKKKKQTSGEFMQSITGMYQLSPEAEERFSKSFILNTKGTVRVSVLSLGPPFLLFVILGTVLYMLSMKLSGLTNLFIILAYTLGVILFFWSKLSWRLTFDGSTGFVQYHTLFGGDHTYHVHELMAFETHVNSITNVSLKYLNRFGKYHHPDIFRIQTLTATEYVRISTEDGVIIIPVASSWSSSNLSRGIGGYVNADKFLNYLELYRRFMYQKDGYPEETAATTSLPQSVRKAIAEEQAKKAAAPAEIPKSFPEPQPDEMDPVAVMQTPKTAPVQDIPAASEPVTGLPKEQPAKPVKTQPAKPVKLQPMPERPLMPERGSAFPDPTCSVFPDPAQKPAAAESTAIPDVTEEPKPQPHENAFPDPAQKPPVDVDALFDKVLAEHGKSRHPEKPKKGLFGK